MGGLLSASSNESPSKDFREDRSNTQDKPMSSSNETPHVDLRREADCSNTQDKTIKGNSNETPSEDPRSKDCSNKQEKTIQRENPEEKVITQGGSDFIPVGVTKKVSMSVCRLEFEDSDDGHATGFLGKFSCDNKLVYGLFTNNHVIAEELLADCDKFVYLKFEFREKRIKLHWKDTFRFTCPLLDVTFIHLEDMATKLKDEFKCEFLSCCLNWMGEEKEQLLVMQNPETSPDLQIASGMFYKMHGFDIFHKASTERGSSGSPLMMRDGTVIGIHKSRAAKDSDQYNVAVSTEAVLAAIFNFKTLPRILISNPKSLDTDYEDQILQKSIKKETKSYKRGVLYSHDTHSSEIPPIWFVPTSHGWYWTPTNPLKREVDVNWMSVQVSKVIGDNSKPADKNIKIINWLCKNNIVMQQ